MKIVGVVGSGMVGRDPWDVRCWSGSSNPLWTACKEKGVLQDVVGIEVDKWTKIWLLLKNFSFDKRLWRSSFNLDPDYYRSLTKEMGKVLSKLSTKDIILQIGGHYNSSQASPSSFTCSYHDGNAAQLSKSPFFDFRLKDKVKKAIDYEKKVYEGLDMIFTMSKYLKKSFQEDYNISEDKVHCIGAGVNIPVPNEVVGKNYNKIKILFVGIDFERKGGKYLVQAFNRIRRKFKNVELVIIGPKTIPDIVKRYPENINFVGYLDKRDPVDLQTLIRYYEECHIGVLPTLYEPFGIVIPEMMFYNIPVIATNDWAIPELVIQNSTGSLIHFNRYNGMIDEIEETLNYYLENVGEIINQGRKARSHVENTYTWNKVVENIVFLIDSKLS